MGTHVYFKNLLKSTFGSRKKGLLKKQEKIKVYLRYFEKQ